MRRSRAGRVIPAGEAVLFVGSILAFIWLIQPATGWMSHSAYYVLMVGFAGLSAVAHGETPHTLGFRLDNLAAAARVVLPATFVLVLCVAAVGWALTARLEPGRALAIVPPYFVWALVQQYGLQAFVQRRLWDAGVVREAPVLAAALFALTHLPNPGLSVLTFLAGWMWAAWYRRCPNLFALAFSHALLAAIVVIALPAWCTGGLRVGPGYWHRGASTKPPSQYLDVRPQTSMFFEVSSLTYHSPITIASLAQSLSRGGSDRAEPASG